MEQRCRGNSSGELQSSYTSLNLNDLELEGRGAADMKTIFVKFCICFATASVFLVFGCKNRNEQDCGPKCYLHSNKEAEKGYAFQRNGAGFLPTFYGDDLSKVVDVRSFAAPSFLSKKCSRISPVENGKTTVPLPAPDTTLCRSFPPGKPVPVGTSFPGIELIGRLELKVSPLDKPAKDYPKDYLWATAFKVGQQTTDGTTYDLIATACHVLQPVITNETGDWKLKPPPGETLWFDRGERTDYPGSSRAPQYPVTELVAYGKKEGLDVAFLKVAHFSEGSLKFPPQRTANSRLATPAPLTVIGYVDLFHPVDPLFDLSYGPFASSGDNKFVSLGRYSFREPRNTEELDAQESSEQRYQGYLFHDAATSMGQSGSPVFALDQVTVLGVHVCCTAYWENEKGKPPVDEKMIPCGKVRRGGHNKAVPSSDILNDKDLCEALNKYGYSYTCPSK